MTSPIPPTRLGLVVYLLGLSCVGCSGTPLGDQLTERLSDPDDPVVEEAVVEEAVVPGQAAVNTPTGEPLSEQPSESGDPVDDPPPANPTATNPVTATSPTPALITIPPLNPAPYRLLLRLPAVDPAAPAEAVTRALRAAGILFEVEAIERLPNESTPLAPSP